MSRESAINELERQLANLPGESLKHDPAIADDFMAQWIARQPVERRHEVVQDLVTWLADHEHPWHDDAALEIATRLGDERLIDAAVDEALRLGVNGSATSPDGRMVPWLKFQLHLIGAIHELPTSRGHAYLRSIAGIRSEAANDAQRELCIRAWITECAISDPAEQQSCLSRAIDQLREWRRPRVLRSALGLIGSYYAHDKGLPVKGLLSEDEFAMAFPRTGTNNQDRRPNRRQRSQRSSAEWQSPIRRNPST